MRTAVRDLLRVAALGRAGWPRLALAAALGACATGSGIGLMGVAAWLIARASQQPPVLTLEVAVVAVRAFGLSRGLARYAERLVGHDAVLRVLADVRGRLVSTLEPLAPGGLEAFRDADLLQRLVSDVEAVQDLYLRVLLPFSVAAITGGAAVAVVGWLLPSAGLLLLVALLGVGIGVPLLLATLERRLGGAVGAARARLAVDALDLLDGGHELLAYGATEAALARVDDSGRRVREVERSAAGRAAVGAGLSLGIQGITVAGALWLSVHAVRAGAMPVVALAVVPLTAIAAFDAVSALPGAALQLGRILESGRRLLQVFDARPPVTEPAPSQVDELAGSGGASVSAPTLWVRGLGVTYPGSDRPALRDVDLDLWPGRRVAVVGDSGAGKSTLVAALLRFVEMDAGTVELGGTDVRSLTGDRVRLTVGACLQDDYVFDTTIRENLALAAQGADDDALWSVLAAVRLAEWVRTLDLGLDTLVGRNGASVSGGQRQRLALARALLADRPILLLDEPTTGVDPAAADALMADILDASAGRAILLVTHHLAGLSGFDEILVTQGGRVVERGTQAELLSGPGAFRRLWDAQTGTAARPFAALGVGTKVPVEQAL